ncbi:hypothetical protein KI387_040390, partial [Taxus chinensis]
FCETTQLLIVCNPVTKSWRILPDLGFSKERFLIGMKADTSKNSYNVYVVENLNDLSSFDFVVYVVENLNDLSSFDFVSIKEEIRVMVYDSLSDCWNTHCFNEVEIKCGCKRDRAVWVGAWEFLPFSSFDLWELEKESGKLLKLDSVHCSALDQITAEPLPVDTVKRIGDGMVLFFHARGISCPVRM